MTAERDELLERHLPFLKYDSLECYFAGSAAEWTDYRANRLLRGKEVIATADPEGNSTPKLSLDFIGSTYANGEKALATDVIGDSEKDYRKAARGLHEQPRYGNRFYGHYVEDGDERWLQYWFFYFYNDFNLIGRFLGAGRHEGDWEMIQLRLRDDDEPDFAVYSQHKHAGVRRWDQVDLVPGTKRPVVYVARGSHACYFEPGPHGTGLWVDLADGKRRASRREPSLEIVREGEDGWGWLDWPGHWGDTKPPVLDLSSFWKKIPVGSDSPTGPAQHKQWRHPRELAELEPGAGPFEGGEHAALPRLTKAVVTRTDDGIAIDYKVGSGDVEGVRGLIVTVNSPDESAPPSAHDLEVEAPADTVQMPLPLDPAKEYDVYVSAAFADRSPTESRRSDLPAIARP